MEVEEKRDRYLSFFANIDCYKDAANVLDAIYELFEKGIKLLGTGEMDCC